MADLMCPFTKEDCTPKCALFVSQKPSPQAAPGSKDRGRCSLREIPSRIDALTANVSSHLQNIAQAAIRR